MMGLQKTDPYASYIYSVSGAQANTVDRQVKLEQEIGDFSKVRRF